MHSINKIKKGQISQYNTSDIKGIYLVTWKKKTNK